MLMPPRTGRNQVAFTPSASSSREAKPPRWVSGCGEDRHVSLSGPCFHQRRQPPPHGPRTKLHAGDRRRSVPGLLTAEPSSWASLRLTARVSSPLQGTWRMKAFNTFISVL